MQVFMILLNIACNMQNMQNNMHDMQICTAHFADGTVTVTPSVPVTQGRAAAAAPSRHCTLTCWALGGLAGRTRRRAGPRAGTGTQTQALIDLDLEVPLPSPPVRPRRIS